MVALDQTIAAAPSDVLIPCGPGCRFAEPLAAGDGGWIWCTRPEAINRVRNTASDCAAFSARVTVDFSAAG